MLISVRLENLLRMMEKLSDELEKMNPFSRRMLAIGMIAEMHQFVRELDAINSNLDSSISDDDASLDSSTWASLRCDFHGFMNEKLYDDIQSDSIINHIVDFFPIDNKDYDFDSKSVDTMKTGMRYLSSNTLIQQRSIVYAIKQGVHEIFSLLYSIQEKKRNIQPFQYEDYWYDTLFRDDDLYPEEARSDYERWQDNHDYSDIQVLKDKRTQEILKLLESGVFSHLPIVNRDKQNCIITIPEDALESGTIIPSNIEEECARMSKNVVMKEDILCLDCQSLGKYLYKYYHDITEEEKNALIYFSFILDMIQEDMSVCNPSLKKYLRWHEDDEQNETLQYAQTVISSCNNLLKNGIPEDFLEEYLNDAFWNGDAKNEVQVKLSHESKRYKLIAQMLGMLKSTLKVFRADVVSSDIEKSLRSVVSKYSENTLKRYVDSGASDVNSKLSRWTTKYVNDKFGSKAERLFVRLSEK